MDKLVDLFPSGVVRVPSSKSAAHRAVICAALATGESRLHGVSMSRDIRATLDAVQVLGARVKEDEKGVLTIGGIDKPPRDCVLDCDESGTTLRFMLPIAAALGVSARFIGKGRLLDRPMKPFEGILNGFSQKDGEITISGGLSSTPYRLPGNISSQFVSGLLLALPLIGGGEILIEGRLESAPYVEMTLEMMQSFGVAVQNEGSNRFVVPNGTRYRMIDSAIEGDYSAAAFFLVAAALGRPVECSGLRENSLQGDRAILDILRRCGVTEGGGSLHGTTVDVSDIPDLVPVLAVLFCFCHGESRIENAARLRLKESDRLSAITTELRKLGADIEEGEDFLRIRGGLPLRGGRVEGWNDHRIVMALAVAAICCEEPVVISGAEAVDKSYPGFWDDFCKERRGDIQWARHGGNI